MLSDLSGNKKYSSDSISQFDVNEYSEIGLVPHLNASQSKSKLMQNSNTNARLNNFMQKLNFEMCESIKQLQSNFVSLVDGKKHTVTFEV